MATMWIAQSLDVLVEETEIMYFICHDPDAKLSFRISVDSIATEYCTSTTTSDFLDGCLTVIIVTFETQVGVPVTLA